MIGAFYYLSQNDYATSPCTGKGIHTSSGSCAGSEDFLSFLIDYRPVKRVDLYLGVMLSNGYGGIASGYQQVQDDRPDWRLAHQVLTRPITDSRIRDPDPRFAPREVKWPREAGPFWRRLSWKAVCWLSLIWLSLIKPPSVLSDADFDLPVGMWSTRLRCPHVHRLPAPAPHSVRTGGLRGCAVEPDRIDDLYWREFAHE